MRHYSCEELDRLASVETSIFAGNFTLFSRGYLASHGDPDTVIDSDFVFQSLDLAGFWTTRSRKYRRNRFRFTKPCSFWCHRYVD